MKKYFVCVLIIPVILCSCISKRSPDVSAVQGIRIGWASADITPNRPVQLFGQYGERISQGVHDPLYATAMAVESASEDMQAIMVSMEILEGTFNLQKDLRILLSGQLPGFNLRNLIINATHTHTAPYPFTPPDRSQPAGLMTGEEYRNQILLPKLTDIVVAAWKNRTPAAVGFAKGTADVGYSRICVYQDGHQVMLGSTVSDKGSPFVGFEGGNDPSLNLMYCFDTEGNIKGIVVNIACPSQDVAGLSVISADFWGEVRSQLQVKYPGISILEQCSAAGDQGPWNLSQGFKGDRSWSSLTTHANIIVSEVNRLFNAAQSCRQSSVELNNQVRDYTLIQKACYGISPFTWELHTIRIGNAVFANNPFELYIGYGNAIKAQSLAAQAFLLQLSGTASDDFLINYTYKGNFLYAGYLDGYLPTAEAVAGGAYGALDENGRIGPEGGTQLVSQTVSQINSLFTGR
jgi:hypothetical protein